MKKHIVLWVLLAPLGFLQAQDVVVNEYANESSVNDEWVELLVITDNLDLRGMKVRDFTTTGNQAGEITFASVASWSSVAMGTIIVIMGDNVNGGTEDTGFGDKVVQIQRSNGSFFSTSGSFNIAGTRDAVQIRTSANAHIHALSHDGADFSGGSDGLAAFNEAVGGDAGNGSLATGDVVRFFDTGATGTFVTADFSLDSHVEKNASDTRAAGNDAAQINYITTTLPVELISFTALSNHNSVILDWTTATETNNAGFDIQHRVGDQFETIAFVEGQGTVLQAHAYRYVVENLPPGRHTFRLRQLDFDGQFEYSPEATTTVYLSGLAHLSEAYPNPFNPRTQFTLTLAQDQSVRVDVMDVLGRRVAVLHEGPLTGEVAHRFVVSGQDWPSGVYVYRAVGPSFIKTGRLLLVK